MLGPVLALGFFLLLIGALVGEELTAPAQEGYADKRLGALLMALAGAGLGVVLWLAEGWNPLAAPFLVVLGTVGWREAYSYAHRNVAVNQRVVLIDRRTLKNYTIAAAVLAICLVVYDVFVYRQQTLIVGPLSVLGALLLGRSWVYQLGKYRRALKPKSDAAADVDPTTA